MTCTDTTLFFGAPMEGHRTESERTKSGEPEKDRRKSERETEREKDGREGRKRME